MSTIPPVEAVLSRELLGSAEFDLLMASGMLGQRPLTDVERDASLRQTMAAKSEGDLWLFAYGSLIWNPAVRFVERREARLLGWHRSFCLTTGAGRVSPDRPGLVLALEEGGRCDGVAYRIADQDLEEELPLLWRREMLFGSYVPTWVDLHDSKGVPFARGITFVVNSGIDRYEPNLDRSAVVHRLATARGRFGTSADYLFRTREALAAYGLRDRHIEELAAQVAAHFENSPGVAA
jgi:cation transport protein ChaC